MAANARSPRFEMIVGLHDLAEPPEAHGDELLSWMPFSEAIPALDRILANTQRLGLPLRVTSDDAFRSDYDILLPWLLDHGLIGTFFIPTRFLGRRGRLSVAHLREMATLGMKIGVHGARHVNWAAVPESEFLDDLREGREHLQDVIGTAVDLVAPPFGGFNGRVLARLFDEDFSEIHTTRPGLALTSEPLKPRNMFKKPRMDAILAVSRTPGGVRDFARCRLRRLRAAFEMLTGAG